MERLTKKINGNRRKYKVITNADLYPGDYTVDDACIRLDKVIDKAGNFEDYEEKHNMDLSNVLSILDNGIWIIYDEGKIINRKPTLRLTNNSYWFEYDYFIYKPEDYGKTWAFTEEELL